MSEPIKTRLDETADGEPLTPSPDLAELTDCITPSDDSIADLADCVDSRPPHTRTSSQDIPAAEQNMAMFCHLAPLSGCITPLGSLVLWLAKKDSMPYVDQEGKKAINFQISVLIYILASMALCIIGVGFILLFALAIFNFIMVVSNGIKAGKGEETRYPLSIIFIK
jgi:uncharacterized Tic20 family protein